MENVLVTVLVPIYNVEKYLRHCLDSLAAQTLESIRFICIDDGSTDSSSQIIGEYVGADSRFEVISKANSGYGASMNRGLEACHSKYVGIVEPDDFAAPRMFEELSVLAERTGADVVKSNYFEHVTGREPGQDVLVENIDPCCVFDEAFDPATDNRILWSSAAIWSGLYRLDFLRSEGIRFLETPGASFQDTSFNLKALMATRKIALTPKGYLHYRIDNAGSSVKDGGKAFYICDEYQMLWDFLRASDDRFEAFAKSLAGIQFKGYCWNQWRLARRLREKFFNRFLNEFAELNGQGLLSKDCFSDYDWNDLSQLLGEPDRFFERACGARGITGTVLVALRSGVTEEQLRAFVVSRDAKEELVVCLEADAKLDFDLAELASENPRVLLASDLSKNGKIDFAELRGNALEYVVLEPEDEQNSEALRRLRELLRFGKKRARRGSARV